MSFNVQPPTQLPESLLKEYSGVERKFIEAMQIKDPSVIEESFDLWDKLYKKILQSQPKGVRYHKGGEVHNMGVCKIYTLQTFEALHFFLLGYIEDLLSATIEKANSAPGASTLQGFYKLSINELEVIQQCVENTIAQESLVQDPQRILNRFLELKTYADLERRVKKISLLIRPNHYSSISHLPGEWEKRVFVGGDYESIHALDSIISPVREFGFETIVAMEYASSKKSIHHDALLLLHNCRYAIFDVASKGGHMMEAERTLDYDTETLFVCKKSEEVRVSTMLSSLGKKYEIHWYKDRRELKKHIFDFLKPEGIEWVAEV